MPLSAGSRLGHYEIQGLLGAGGMGEVYRGRDTRLDRAVAIKVLTGFADSRPDQRQRFEREARVIANLNHPNICVLYDVGEQDGLPFIVMEHLEGETLAGRLARSPLSIDDALTIAGDILDALEHAHRRGVTHRDLKPSNVMLTRDGTKLLDFGLAKITEVTEGGGGAGRRETEGVAVATRTVPVTIEGTILGSLNYMAPEQLHGQDVDARTDLFAFGAVLYEMVTGRRAFTGPSNASVIAAILERQPEPVASLAPRAPALVDRIVTKCLAKKPDDRWQSATDLKQALQWARAGVGGLGDPGQPVRSRGWRFARTAALLLLAIALAVAATLRYLPPPPDIRFSPIATESDYQGSPAWSPDGNRLAYLAEVNGVVQVMTRARGSATRSQITYRTADCRNPFWNEDGTRIYFISRSQEYDTLWVIGAAGGADAETKVIENVNVTAAALSPDGKSLAFFREEGVLGANAKTLWTKAMPDGEPKSESRFADRTFGDAALAFSPDGQTLGIWGSLNQGLVDGPRTFWVLSLPAGPVREALQNLPGGNPSFSWFPDSRHILATISQPPETHLWTLDTRSGRAWPVTAGMTQESHPAVAKDGLIAMNSEQADFDLIEVSLDQPSSAPLLATTRREFDPAWVQGDRYAFVTDRMGEDQIWMSSRPGPQSALIERELVTERDFEGETFFLSAPAFTRDGQRFVFARYGEMSTLYVKTLGSGRPYPLLTPAPVSFAPTWSPDEAWVAFVGPTATADWTLRKVRVGSNDEPIVLAGNISPRARPQWAPNGKWLVCDTTGGLALVPSDPGGKVVVFSERNWFAYAWLDDGHVVGVREDRPSRRLVLSSIDVATREEKILNADLGPVPFVNEPVKGMTRASARSFVMGLARARSSIMLLEGPRTPGALDRWRVATPPPWQRRQP